MPVLRARLLGPPRFAIDGEQIAFRSGRARAVFCYLVATRQQHSRDRLAGLFWPDVPEKNAAASLRTALYDVRRSLGDHSAGVMAVDRARVGVAPDVVLELDVERLEIAAEAGESVGAVDPEQLEAAVEACGGPFLDGVGTPDAPEFDDWVFLERERFQQLYFGALCRLGEHHAERGAHSRAIDLARRVLAVEPLREEIHRSLMRYLAMAGRREQALAQYRTCEELLRSELGIEPLEATRQLRDRIAAGEALEAESRQLSAMDRAAAARLRGPATLEVALAVAERGRAGLVGRAAEREQILSAWNRALAGEGGAVVLCGEPGIGKTHLVADFIREAVAGSGEGVQVLHGRAWESSSSQPYAVIIDALRSARPSVDYARLPIAEVWRNELARLMPELSRHAGDRPPPLDGVRERDRLFEGVRSVVRTLADDRPVVMALEDLHWADETSMSLLAYIARASAGTRLLLLCTCREQDASDARMVALNGIAADGVRIELQPLSEADSEELIRRSIGADRVPSSFARRVLRRAGGNPFFITEMLRSLVEQGTLTKDANGKWSTTPGSAEAAYAELPIPERISLIIDGRLARLDEDAKTMLECAAVLRRGFGFELVQRLTGLPAPAALDALDALMASDLVLELEERGLEPRFDFKHALVRERVYSRLSGARRQYLHRQVAGYLEAGSPVQPDRVAYHYTRGGVRERAYRWSLRAGEAALGLYAGEDAAAHFQTAKQLAVGADELYAALAGAGDAQVGMGCPEAAVRHYSEALEHAPDDEAGAELHRRIGRAHERLGAFDAALDAYGKTRSLLRGKPVSLTAVRSLDGLATVYVRLGRVAEATALSSDALTVLEMCAGLSDEARAEAEANVRNTLGMAYLHGDRYADALANLQTSLELKRKLGERLGEATLLNNLGVVHYHAGNDDQARQHYSDSLDIKREIGDVYGQAIACANLALIEIHLGRLEAAARHLAFAERAAEDVAAAWLLPEIMRVAAQHALAAGDGGRARDLARRALVTAEELGVPAFIGVAHRVLGLVSAEAEHNLDAADAHFRTSLAVFEMLDNTHELAKTRAAFGQTLLSAGRTEDAGELLVAALEAFRAAGATGRAARLDALLQGGGDTGQGRGAGERATVASEERSGTSPRSSRPRTAEAARRMSAAVRARTRQVGKSGSGTDRPAGRRPRRPGPGGA